MKKILSLVLVFVLAAALGACGGSGSSGGGTGTTTTTSDGKTYDNIRLKMSYSGTETGIDGLVAARMKEMLEERSGGSITLDTFGNAQLASGNMQRQVEMLIAGGSFELAIIAENILADVDQSFYVNSIPFAYANYEEAYRYADTTGGEWSAAKMAEYGITRLDCFSNSLMHLTNNKRAIVEPGDMKDLKVRAYGDLQMQVMRELGADPVHMNWSEVYSAMQMGTIDGHMNGYQTIDSASVYEVQNNLTECGIVWAVYDVVANAESWEALSPDTRELIQEVATECSLWGRDYLSGVEGEIKEKFRENGVTITELTEEQLQAFKDATSGTRDSFVELCGEEACIAWGIL